jgi:hypothetical protein
LAGTAHVSRSGHHHDVLDVHGVGQGGTERSVIQVAVGGQTRDRGYVYHRGAQVRRGANGTRERVHVAESSRRRIIRCAKLVAGLADADDGGLWCDATERRTFGVRFCADDSGHHGAVPVAILGAVGGGYVVTAGNEVGEQPMS